MFTELSQSFQPPFLPFRPYPQAADRASWEELPASLREELVKNGEQFLRYTYPALSATDYMDFCRTGNRERYQERLFARRIALNHLVLAECAEYQGRFLDDIINGIFAICEESAWQLPAHNSYIRDTPQLPLPDVTRPVIDLFAAETGAILATARYLLGSALDAVSPAVGTLIAHNLEIRIFTPYLRDHFWWMGDGESHMNNWTSWCTQNVLLAAGFCPPEPERIPAIFSKACKSLDYFLAEYGEDGCCDEGAQYFRHAGLTLFNSMEVLNAVTGGCFSPLYREEKIRNIAAYIMNVHVHDAYYVNFADCSPAAGRCGAREFLFGRRTGQPELMAFAAQDYRRSEDRLQFEEHNLFYHLQTVFTHQEMMEFDVSAPPAYRDLYYPSAGLFLARDPRLFLAVKAGDNDDSHNHNDTGSFTVYKDGLPLFIDVGVETYTQKTFSPRRYEIWTMQSRFHNLPTFGDDSQVTASDDIPADAGGIVQKAGPQYGARAVETCFGGTECRISMDIAGAYGDSRIRSYRRSAALIKETAAADGTVKAGRVTVTDTYDGSVLPAVLSLMTYEEPSLSQVETGMSLPDGNAADAPGWLLSAGSLGSCLITGAASVTSERIPITDARLRGAWKHDIYRTLVTFSGNQISLTIW